MRGDHQLSYGNDLYMHGLTRRRRCGVEGSVRSDPEEGIVHQFYFHLRVGKVLAVLPPRFNGDAELG
jgi:hypothetical protein